MSCDSSLSSMQPAAGSGGAYDGGEADWWRM